MSNIVKLINKMGVIDFKRPVSRTESKSEHDHWSRPFLRVKRPHGIYKGNTQDVLYRDSVGLPEEGLPEHQLYVPADVEL